MNSLNPLSPERLGEVTLALVAGYLVALSSVLLSRVPVRGRFPGFVLLSSGLLACPFLVSRHHPLLRGIVAGITTYFWLKAWDAAWNVHEASPKSVPQFLLRLLNFGWLVGTPGNRFPGQRSRGRVLDFAGWHVGFGGTVLAIYWAFACNWERLPFLVEHCVKAVTILLSLLCAFNAHAAMWRLVGIPSLRSPLNVLSADSPAVFWRQWNRPVGLWFGEYVFKRVGGVNRLWAATLFTFLVSGLMHEYLVSMFTGRITGYPTAFYLIQGFAVAATFRFRATGCKHAGAIVLTWVFVALSSVLLFAPLCAALSFYDNRLPGWLYFEVPSGLE